MREALLERIVGVQSLFIEGSPLPEVLQLLLAACVEASGAEAGLLCALDTVPPTTLAVHGEAHREALEAAAARPVGPPVGTVLTLPCLESDVVAGLVVLSAPRGFPATTAASLGPVTKAAANLLTAGLAARRRDEALSRQLDEAVAVASDGSFEWDIPAGAVRYSARFLEMLGLDEPGPSVAEWVRMLHPDDVPRQEAAIEAHYFGRAPFYQAEYRCRHARTGAWVWLEVRGAIVERRLDGTPVKLIGNHTDISHRKDLEGRLARTDRLSALGTMAAGVAHEVNNPLAFMHSNIEYVRRALEEPLSPPMLEELDRALGEALEGTSRIGRIVRGLRVFAAPSKEERKPVQLSAVVKTAVRLSGSMLSSRAPVAIDVSDELVVLGDESELVQVVLNLLLNAAQALRPGALHQQVGVSAQAELPLVRLEVTDTGTGIAPKHLRRVFDPFFTTKPIGEGTGLGLAISHSLVTAHGGDITLANRPTGGCCVTVRLPAATWSSLDTPLPTAVKPVKAPRARVLVIDDEPLMRSALLRGLTADHDVAQAADGVEAVVMLDRDRRWDVVLCDVMMSGLNGLDVLERVTRFDPDLARRFVFITGGAWDPEVQRRLQALPNQRVEKPVSLLELREVIARCVEP